MGGAQVIGQHHDEQAQHQTDHGETHESGDGSSVSLESWARHWLRLIQATGCCRCVVRSGRDDPGGTVVSDAVGEVSDEARLSPFDPEIEVTPGRLRARMWAIAASGRSSARKIDHELRDRIDTCHQQPAPRMRAGDVRQVALDRRPLSRTSGCQSDPRGCGGAMPKPRTHSRLRVDPRGCGGAGSCPWESGVGVPVLGRVRG